MTTQDHFPELLRLFEENQVEYVIVGGFAVAFHGYPRFTKDLDIFFHNTSENIRQLRRALVAFDFPEADLPEDVFSKTGNIIRFGISPMQVDLLNEIDGISFEEAYRNSVRGKYGQVEARFLGRAELIRNKKVSGRAQDLVDAENLEKPAES